MSATYQRVTPLILSRGVLPPEVRPVVERAALTHPGLLTALAESRSLTEPTWFELYAAGKKTPVDQAAQLAVIASTQAQIDYILATETRSKPLERLVDTTELTPDQTRQLAPKRAFAQFGVESLVSRTWVDPMIAYAIARDRGGKALLHWLVRFDHLLDPAELLTLFEDYPAWAPPTGSSEARSIAWDLLGVIFSRHPQLYTQSVLEGRADLLGVVAASHLLFDPQLQDLVLTRTPHEDIAAAGDRAWRLAANPLTTPDHLDRLRALIPANQRFYGALHTAWMSLNNRAQLHADDSVTLSLDQVPASQLRWVLEHGWSKPGWACWSLAGFELLHNPNLSEALAAETGPYQFDLVNVALRPFFEYGAKRALGDRYDALHAQLLLQFPDDAASWAAKCARPDQTDSTRLSGLLSRSAHQLVTAGSRPPLRDIQLLTDHLVTTLGDNQPSWELLFGMETAHEGSFGQLIELAVLLGAAT
jgi:hypothetical protein